MGCPPHNMMQCLYALHLQHSFMFSLSSQGGATPLMGAAQGGHSEVVSFLLDNGAHVEAAAEVRRDHINCYGVRGDDAG